LYARVHPEKKNDPENTHACGIKEKLVRGIVRCTSDVKNATNYSATDTTRMYVVPANESSSYQINDPGNDQ